MPSYHTDREWSDRYIPEIKRIVGPLLLEVSSFEEDTKQASDLIVIGARSVTIACRVRRHGYEEHIHDFTIRSKRDNGTETELKKITNGWGDLMFYAHASGEPGEIFSAWYLIDLKAWRAAMIRWDPGKTKRKIRCGQISNGDGTWFAWFDIRSFPEDPSILIASSYQEGVHRDRRPEEEAEEIK